MSAINTPANVISRPTNSIVTRIYETDFRLFAPIDEQDEILFVGAPALHPNAGGERRLDPICRKVVEHIFGLEGVDSVLVSPYEIGIRRATAFDWDALDAPLLYLIASADPELRDTVLPPAPVVDHVHRIRWFDMQSRDQRHYGLTVRMFTPRHNLDIDRLFPPRAGKKTHPLTAEGDALIGQLANIPGIARVHFGAFEVNVAKEPDYSWDELHAPIRDALYDCFPEDASVVSHRVS